MSVALCPPADSSDAPSPTDKVPGRVARPLVLDLSGVDHLTTSGLGELVVLHDRLHGMGGELVLVNVDDKVHEVLRLARLTERLHVRPRSPSSLPRS
jgi:anti-anti-sigma factor